METKIQHPFRYKRTLSCSLLLFMVVFELAFAPVLSLIPLPGFYPLFWVYLGVRTCEVFLCFVAIVRVRSIMMTSLFSLIVLRHWRVSQVFTPMMSHFFFHSRTSFTNLLTECLE